MTAAAAIYPYKTGMEKKYTHVSRYGDPFVTYKLSGYGGNASIHLPRAICPIGKLDKRVVGIPVSFPKANFIPRNEDQSEAVDYCSQLLQGDESHILEAPTGCLVGSTEIIVNRAGKSVRTTLEEAYRHTHPPTPVPEGYCFCGCGGKTTVPERTRSPKRPKGVPSKFLFKHEGRVRQWKNSMQVRSFLGTHIGLNKANAVVQSGVKEVYRLTLGDCNFLVGTKDHPIMTTEGFVPLGDLTPDHMVMCDRVRPTKQVTKAPKVRDKYINNMWKHPFAVRIRTTKEARGYTRRVALHVAIFEARTNKLSLDDYITVCRLGKTSNLDLVDPSIYVIHHKDGNHSNNSIDNLQKMLREDHYSHHASPQNFGNMVPYYVPVESVVYVGEEMTYDIQCEAPHHNFVANGIVVHNSGKTFMGMAIAANMGLCTLVVVPKTDLVDQWIVAAKGVLGLTDSEIGIVKGDKCSYEGKKLVIGLVHSLCKEGRYPDALYRQFGLIIFDEVHVMGAETFSELVWLFPAKYRLGLSATPYRKDGRERLFTDHIGQVLVRIEGNELPFRIFRKETGWKVPRVKKKNPQTGAYDIIQLPHSAGKLMHIFKLMAGNEKRNSIIGDFVAKAYTAGRNILVVSDLKEDHLDRLYALFAKLGVARKDMGYYVGTMSKKDLEISKAKQVILATYGMINFGTNIPWLDTLVMATPRSDVVQIVGRILREYPDKSVPIVFDPVDSDSSVMASYAATRRKWYLSKETTIEEH
jgi:superfamily II DNA or RNA helicase